MLMAAARSGSGGIFQTALAALRGVLGKDDERVRNTWPLES